MSDKPLSSFWPLVVFGAILSALAIVQAKNKKTSKSIGPQQGASEKQNDARSQATFIPYPIPTPPNPSSTHDSKRKTPLWEKLAVLVALGLLVANILQVRAVKKGNDVAKNAYQSGQRAFIVYEDMTHTMDVVRNPMGEDTIVFTLGAKWQNTGNTPAVRAISVIGASVQDEEITEREFLAAPPGILIRQPVAAIGPKVPVGSGPLHADESFADKEQKTRYIWGWVLYRDIFPNTEPHVSEFCYRVTKIEKIDILNYSFEDATACSHHNCIDEFCDDYANIAALSPKQ